MERSEWRAPRRRMLARTRVPPRLDRREFSCSVHADVQSEPPTEADSRALALGMLLAALAPLFAVIASTSAYPPASGEARLLAAALELSPAEPPGYALATWWARAFALVPLGPLALRVALASGALYAVAAAALFAAIDRALRAQTALRPLFASPLALAVTLLAFGSPPLFADTPHAHAAAIALACLCLERLVAFEAAWPRLELMPLRMALLWFALLAPEQPALAAVLLLATVPTARRLLASYELPAWNLAPLLLGVPLWLFGAVSAGVELGLPVARTPWSMLQSAFAPSAIEPALVSRLPASPFEPALTLTYALIALGVLGAAVALRAPRQRVSALWLGVGLAALCGALFLPDTEAHAALGLCAAAALSALALAALLTGAHQGWLATVTAVALVLVGLAQVQTSALRARSLSRGAADALGDALRRDLPPRSALLLGPDLATSIADYTAEERVRPDLLVAVEPWRLDFAAAKRVAAHSPELLPLLRAALLDAAARPLRAALPELELATLASRRPVLLELDPVTERSLHDILLPFAFYHRVSTSGVGDSDIDLAAREREQRLARAYATLDLPHLPEPILHLLAARHVAELDYALGHGHEGLAKDALARLNRLPLTRPQLRRALTPLLDEIRDFGLDLERSDASPRP